MTWHKFAETLSQLGPQLWETSKLFQLLLDNWSSFYSIFYIVTFCEKSFSGLLILLQRKLL